MKQETKKALGQYGLSAYQIEFIERLENDFRVELFEDDLPRIHHCKNEQEMIDAIVEFVFEQVIEEHDGEEYQDLLSYELDGEYSVFYWDGIEEIHSAAELDAAIKAWYNE